MSEPPTITIELFGIPRLRAGVPQFSVRLPVPCRLGEVFAEIQRVNPALGEELFAGGVLKPEYVANISGQTFTRCRDHEVLETDSVLILSSDAGG